MLRQGKEGKGERNHMDQGLHNDGHPLWNIHCTTTRWEPTREVSDRLASDGSSCANTVMGRSVFTLSHWALRTKTKMGDVVITLAGVRLDVRFHVRCQNV